MLNLPSGSKLDQVFNSPKHAVDHIQKGHLTGRLDFVFNLKTVHVLWRDGKPVGAILALKFGLPEYGRGVIDKVPEMVNKVSRIEFYKYSEGNLFSIFVKNPDATLVERAIDINHISVFLQTAPENTLRLLKMILFSETGEIEALKAAYGTGFDQSLGELVKKNVVSTDGIKCTVPQHVRMIMRNEVISSMLNEQAIISALSMKDSSISEIVDLVKQGSGSISINTINQRYPQEEQRNKILETEKMFLDKNVMIETVDNRGDKRYIMPDDVLTSVLKVQEGIARGEITPQEAASIKDASSELKAERDAMRKKLMEKYKVRELEKDELQNIMGKFYEG
ncbi:MAG: hypothetical protein V3T58_05950 [Candidatus Hydrothermarchaeales archaeon]